MARKLGVKSKVYRNSGTYGSPTWVEFALVSDLVVHGDWNKARATDRESVVEIEERSTLPLTVSGRCKVVDADAGYKAMDDCFHDSTTVLDLMVLNGDSAVNDVTGVRADFGVTKWSEDQGLANALFKEFEWTPSGAAGNKPKRVKIASNLPVFTDFN